MSPLDTLTLAFLAAGALAFVALLLIDAPYGRHARPGWGPSVDPRAAWIAMELPAVIVFPATAFLLGGAPGTAGIAMLALWSVHYVHRTFVYPWTRRGRGTRVPLSIVAMAFAFNVLNGTLHGAWLAGAPRDVSWLSDPRFAAGTLVFGLGFALNVSSDARLARLRAPGGTGYRIPQGGAFELVSCPNYLGEVLEWCGWAVLTWSLPGLAFAAWTAANLVPRALAHHRWYRAEFPGYPAGRRAIVPWLL